jgi:hypothetical protein
MAFLDYFAPNADPRVPVHAFVAAVDAVKLGLATFVDVRTQVEGTVGEGFAFTGPDQTKIQAWVNSAPNPTVPATNNAQALATLNWHMRLQQLENVLMRLELGMITVAEAGAILGDLA